MQVSSSSAAYHMERRRPSFDAVYRPAATAAATTSTVPPTPASPPAAASESTQQRPGALPSRRVPITIIHVDLHSSLMWSAEEGAEMYRYLRHQRGSANVGGNIMPEFSTSVPTDLPPAAQVGGTPIFAPVATKSAAGAGLLAVRHALKNIAVTYFKDLPVNVPSTKHLVGLCGIWQDGHSVELLPPDRLDNVQPAANGGMSPFERALDTIVTAGNLAQTSSSTFAAGGGTDPSPPGSPVTQQLKPSKPLPTGVINMNGLMSLSLEMATRGLNALRSSQVPLEMDLHVILVTCRDFVLPVDQRLCQGESRVELTAISMPWAPLSVERAFPTAFRWTHVILESLMHLAPVIWYRSVQRRWGLASIPSNATTPHHTKVGTCCLSSKLLSAFMFNAAAASPVPVSPPQTTVPASAASSVTQSQPLPARPVHLAPPSATTTTTATPPAVPHRSPVNVPMTSGNSATVYTGTVVTQPLPPTARPTVPTTTAVRPPVAHPDYDPFGDGPAPPPPRGATAPTPHHYAATTAAPAPVKGKTVWDEILSEAKCNPSTPASIPTVSAAPAAPPAAATFAVSSYPTGAVSSAPGASQGTVPSAPPSPSYAVPASVTVTLVDPPAARVTKPELPDIPHAQPVPLVAPTIVAPLVATVVTPTATETETPIPSTTGESLAAVIRSTNKTEPATPEPPAGVVATTGRKDDLAPELPSSTDVATAVAPPPDMTPSSSSTTTDSLVVDSKSPQGGPAAADSPSATDSRLVAAPEDEHPTHDPVAVTSGHSSGTGTETPVELPGGNEPENGGKGGEGGDAAVGADDDLIVEGAEPSTGGTAPAAVDGTEPSGHSGQPN